MIEKYRDISIMKFGDKLLSVACDSCGGVGLLKGDTVHTDGYNVGYHTTFVCLAETLAIGAQPILIADTLSVSLNSYGKSILNGIKAAAEEAGLNPKTSVTGSSEENFKVQSTGIGITVLGSLPNIDYRPNPLDNIYDTVVIGVPLVGDEVLEKKHLILTLEAIKTLKKEEHVLDLLPVGSRGILYETNQMAGSLGMRFNETVDDSDMIRKSAGPATCAVAAVSKGSFEKLKTAVTIPVQKIGTFTK